MFLKTLLSATFAIGISVSAQASTLTSTFDATPTRGSSVLPSNDIISLTMTDMVGGGVSVKVTALDSFEGIGSFFIGGADAADFSGPFSIFNTSGGNAYPTDLGVSGAVFSTDGSSLFGGAMAIFTSTTSLSTADFLTATIGFISTTTSAPDSLKSLYGGSFSSTTTAAVPLPAGLPLALLGLGALGLVGRRRKLA